MLLNNQSGHIDLQNNNSELILHLRHDINVLLGYFNELDRKDTGFINEDQLRTLFRTIEVHGFDTELNKQFQNPEAQQISQRKSMKKSLNKHKKPLKHNQRRRYDFDHILSIIGRLQVPKEPSIYVISFIKILAQYRDSCIREQESSQKAEKQDSLIEAKKIEAKIQNIIRRELERQKTRIELENKLMYEEMEQSQNQQYLGFEEEWKNYIKEFEVEGAKKIREKSLKRKGDQQENQQSRVQHLYDVPLVVSSNRGSSTSRYPVTLNQESGILSPQPSIGSPNSSRLVPRRYSVLTSTKLTQLEDRKKKLVQSGKFSEALKLKEQISNEKKNIESNRMNQTQYIASKRSETMKRKEEKIMESTFMNVEVNRQKMLNKKKEGEQIMKIRMRSIREETRKKLDQRAKSEISRLKSMFYTAQHSGIKRK